MHHAPTAALLLPAFPLLAGDGGAGLPTADLLTCWPGYWPQLAATQRPATSIQTTGSQAFESRPTEREALLDSGFPPGMCSYPAKFTSNMDTPVHLSRITTSVIV